MKITMLGTGNAGVTEYFNTCFVISDGDRNFLVDTGGGNGLLGQLKKVNISLDGIGDIFITHRHSDHMTGIIWILRMFSKRSGEVKDTDRVNIYGNSDVVNIVRVLAATLFSDKELRAIEARVNLVRVEDGDEKEILGHRVKFFDIHSTKAPQFGFSMELENGKLTCFGDEPYNETCKGNAEGSTWMMHEAFCLHSQEEIFHPRQKSHSTVKDACENAERFGVSNLIIYHTEEKTIGRRKELYTAEGKQYYHGNLFVPEDLETIEIG